MRIDSFIDKIMVEILIRVAAAGDWVQRHFNVRRWRLHLKRHALILLVIIALLVVYAMWGRADTNLPRSPHGLKRITRAMVFV